MTKHRKAPKGAERHQKAPKGTGRLPKGTGRLPKGTGRLPKGTKRPLYRKAPEGYDTGRPSKYRKAP